MSTHRKKWSPTFKLEVIEYYKQNGISKASRQFNVSAVSIYNWEKQFETGGVEGLSDKQKQKTDTELLSLRRENERLKRIVADKELTISIQNDLLKKSK